MTSSCRLLDWPSGSALSFALTVMAIARHLAVEPADAGDGRAWHEHDRRCTARPGRHGGGARRDRLPAGAGDRRGARGVQHDVLPDHPAAGPDAAWFGKVLSDPTYLSADPDEPDPGLRLDG